MTGLAGTAVLDTGPVGAQEVPDPPALTLSITPTSGPAGTRIIASGTGCVGPDSEPTFTSAGLFSADEPFVGITGNEDHVNDPGGSWSLDSGSSRTALIPMGSTRSGDGCTTHSPDPGNENTVGFYDSVPFDVTVEAGPAAPATPQAGSGGAAPSAAPASPVPGDPSFTG